MKYIDADRLREELQKPKNELKAGNYYLDNSEQAVGYENALVDFELLIDSLQQELDSRSIPVLRADTTEKQDRILEIIGQDEIYCQFSLDSGKETDCGYEDYNDRVYIDGDLTFNKMAEIVDFLGKNSK